MSHKERVQESIETAVQLAAAGEYNAAEEVLSSLSEEERSQAPVCVVRAKIKAQQGLHREATELWRQAFEADSENEEIVQGLALSNVMSEKGARFFYLRANIFYVLLLFAVVLLSGTLIWLAIFGDWVRPASPKATDDVPIEAPQLAAQERSGTVEPESAVDADSDLVEPGKTTGRPESVLGKEEIYEVSSAQLAEHGVSGNMAIPAPTPEVPAEADLEHSKKDAPQNSGSDKTEHLVSAIHELRSEVQEFRRQLRELEQAKSTANPASEPPPSAKPDIRLSIDGVLVREDEHDGIALVFENGLFDRGTELTSQAEVLLSELAKEVRPHSGKIGVHIVGFSDSLPFSSKSGDHVSLGYERALRVARFFRNDLDLPQGEVTIGSSGQESLPFPDTPGNRGRNRTVTIRLVNRRG